MFVFGGMFLSTISTVKMCLPLIRHCLDFFFITHHSISVTYHSLLITHHLKYPTCLAPSLIYHHSIFFTLFVGPYLSLDATFFFPIT